MLERAHSLQVLYLIILEQLSYIFIDNRKISFTDGGIEPYLQAWNQRFGAVVGEYALQVLFNTKQAKFTTSRKALNSESTIASTTANCASYRYFQSYT